jgi:hypothetical protein
VLATHVNARSATNLAQEIGEKHARLRSAGDGYAVER